MPDKDQFLARLDTIEERLNKIEQSLNVINHELGNLLGRAQSNGKITLLIKYVIFPLIVVVGGVVGIKLVI